MKITRCATAVVEANYDYTYVRVHADNGLYGTGECFFAPGLSAALRDIFPLLVGRDPREVDRIARFLWRKGSGAGAVAGYLYNAVSGIETALWDLVGIKHKHRPTVLAHKLQWPHRPRTVQFVLQSVFMCETAEALGRRMLLGGKHG